MTQKRAVVESKKIRWNRVGIRVLQVFLALVTCMAVYGAWHNIHFQNDHGDALICAFIAAFNINSIRATWR